MDAFVITLMKGMKGIEDSKRFIFEMRIQYEA